MHLAINVHMFPRDCNEAVAAALGHVGPNALGSVNRDADAKTTYQDLLDTKVADVRSTLPLALCADVVRRSLSRPHTAVCVQHMLKCRLLPRMTFLPCTICIVAVRLPSDDVSAEHSDPVTADVEEGPQLPLRPHRRPPPAIRERLAGDDATLPLHDDGSRRADTADRWLQRAHTSPLDPHLSFKRGLILRYSAQHRFARCPFTRLAHSQRCSRQPYVIRSGHVL